MARTLMALLVAVCAAVAIMVSADQGTRMTDKQVTKLMETIEKDVEHFTKAIDSQYRKATLKSPNGEVNIADYLKNLKDLAKKMKSRFDSKNPAKEEVLAFLRFSQSIQVRHNRGDSLFGAEKEWPRLSNDISQLSEEYGIRWRLDPSYWNVSRLNDKQLGQVLDSFRKSIGDFKKDLDKAAKKADIAQAERKKVIDTIKRMEEVAKDVKKALDKATDASGALALLKSSVEETKSFISQKGLETAVASSWGDVNRSWELIRSAFHLSEF